MTARRPLPTETAAAKLGQEQTGKFIADSLLELRDLSSRAKLPFLTTLLEMTYQEAFMVANRVRPAKEEADEHRGIIERAREWNASQRKKF